MKKGFFVSFAQQASILTGNPYTFLTALSIIIIWGITGPIFDYSETWQLVINTGTSVITFLMVFLIQSTQNRDSKAMQLKLDELIRSSENAHNALLNFEELSEEELEGFIKKYIKMGETAQQELRAGKSDEAVSAIDVKTSS
mgnify:CR=1 FL=1